MTMMRGRFERIFDERFFIATFFKIHSSAVAVDSELDSKKRKWELGPSYVCGSGRVELPHLEKIAICRYDKGHRRNLTRSPEIAILTLFSN